MATESSPSISKCDPATGEPLPPALTYQQFCDLWPMAMGTLRKRVASGWVRVQRVSHKHVHITRAEFIRLRHACQEQGGKPVVRTAKPKKKRSRRRS